MNPLSSIGKKCVWAVDIGAGSGAKLGLGEIVSGNKIAPQMRTAFLAREQYGDSAETLAVNLAAVLKKLIPEGRNFAPIAVGLACPGLFNSDGTCFAISNIQMLRGKNLPKLLKEQLGIPVFIENDANAGGIAEWDLARHTLLYWVLGGGWGGAWISSQGVVYHPVLDWDGKDESLHMTNEPGYSTPILLSECEKIFTHEKVSLESFLKYAREADYKDGPNKRSDSFRAEALLCGPGRWRLFRSVVDSMQADLSKLGETCARALDKPGTSGPYLQQLCEDDFEPALKTERIFGRVLGLGAEQMWNQMLADNPAPGIPAYIAGGPARLFDFFAPHTIAEMEQRNIPIKLVRSEVELRDENPNLRGAAVLALHRAHLR